jgi:hypothetical protein
MQKWEYLEVDCLAQLARKINLRDAKEVRGWQQYKPFYQLSNELGDEGWELTGIVPNQQAQVGFVTGISFLAYFKRIKS